MFLGCTPYDHAPMLDFNRYNNHDIPTGYFKGLGSCAIP